VKRFTDLYFELDETMRTTEKVEALARYFKEAPPLDGAWAVFVLSGRKIGRTVSSTQLRLWGAEASGHPQWLVDQCYRVVGDLSETLSLLVPAPGDSQAAPPLHEVIEHRVRALGLMTQEKQKQSVQATWAQLDTDQRLVFHKLLSGNFRVGVSKNLLIRALAEAAGVQPAIIAHRLAGNWQPDESTMPRLLAGHDPDAPIDPGVPYPFMLAHALQEGLPSLGPIDDWLIEWKWDGIRAQVIRREGKTTLWSRGDEAVAGAFPEIVQMAAMLPSGTVLDGEIVAWDDTEKRPMPFTRLQRRLNRQTVEMSFWPEVPVTFIAFDMLELDGVDLRPLELKQRRAKLDAVIQAMVDHSALQQSTPLCFERWDQITELVADARRRGVEGVMLKRWSSPYQPGRPTGLWWKLKVEPFTMDAVLIAAEPGRGRRAGLLTDYTFGVWDEGMLVPITKAYSGLTDEEIAEVDRFARSHTTARHGPVHAVEPLRVFEIGFEAIQLSTRHKSGIALRFPRMLRMRKDKKPADADTLQTMRDLLTHVEALR
jgi:DNA ligase-1